VEGEWVWLILSTSFVLKGVAHPGDGPSRGAVHSHGQFTYLGPQSFDQFASMVVLIGMALKGRGSCSEELLSPLAEGGTNDGQLPAECFEVLTAEQTDDSLSFALG